MNLLEIQSSVRLERSISRSLSKQFIYDWKTTHSSIQRTYPTKVKNIVI